MTNNASKLSRQQKEAVALLSIGTFLEYFDLMLYVHMAVLLNGLFFPQDNPTTAKLMGALAIVMTFVLRPIGGFVIGWIGDEIGRKATIVITTLIMATSCLMMATVGTYAEIGITATIIVMVCRMLQGFSSLGEVMGASLYLSEIFKPPHRYMAWHVECLPLLHD
ncbi:MFS transporter [Candidatus Bandiella euplotis]|uniref:MFS transporter domain protein n=1 Tax=Candidatus Bandiella euplotis TaxID=1664265 RepID=A0ABZ0UN55_9RICK|nr:MFS transporter [Candidatus Bandiella woodruffii]WPX96133.1 Putative MFS transporter domain protein [Candidatus Bandiella woodruffii]